MPERETGGSVTAFTLTSCSLLPHLWVWNSCRFNQPYLWFLFILSTDGASLYDGSVCSPSGNQRAVVLLELTVKSMTELLSRSWAFTSRQPIYIYASPVSVVLYFSQSSKAVTFYFVPIHHYILLCDKKIFFFKL